MRFHTTMFNIPREYHCYESFSQPAFIFKTMGSRSRPEHFFATAGKVMAEEKTIYFNFA
jgi:hypothetical protein